MKYDVDAGKMQARCNCPARESDPFDGIEE